jgi:hypothetical protein
LFFAAKGRPQSVFEKLKHQWRLSNNLTEASAQLTFTRTELTVPQPWLTLSTRSEPSANIRSA